MRIIIILMNYTACNTRYTVQRQNQSFSISGNNNHFIITNSQVVFTVNGNNNKFDIKASRANITINGNNNYMQIARTSYSIGINGNNNTIANDAESTQQISYDNGVNNRYGRGQGRINQVNSSRDVQRNVDRNQQNQQRNRNINQNPSNQYQFSYPQYQYYDHSQAPANSFNMSSLGNQGFGMQFAGGLGFLNSAVRQTICMNNDFGIGRSLLYSQTRPRQYIFHGNNEEQEVNVGLKKQQLELLPISKHIGKQGKCVMCQCEIEVGEDETFLMCFHSFHWACIKDWLVKNGKCPVCQFDITKHFRCE